MLFEKIGYKLGDPHLLEIRDTKGIKFFTFKPNGRCDIPDDIARNLLKEAWFGLKYKRIDGGPMAPPPSGNGVPCPECDFVAKTDHGLVIHSRTHRKKEV